MKLQIFIYTLFLKIFFLSTYTKLKKKQYLEDLKKVNRAPEKPLIEKINLIFKKSDPQKNIEDVFPFVKNISYNYDQELNFNIINIENIDEKQKLSFNVWIHVLKMNIKKISDKPLSFNDYENIEYQNMVSCISF